MAKIFYTERDIQDLMAQGVNSLTMSDDVVVTDLAREHALKIGFKFIRPSDSPTPASAPARSPMAKPVAPKTLSAVPPSGNIEDRVFQAVVSKLGDTVDQKLLRTIVRRVLQSVGGGK